ncbi:unnamed protein product [Echinostoma caproni]|uniref:Rho-GAP domain-containing protein n=1 Tax=Echinostoma caproni TaxID=27848 RepID=A0A183AX50_9TREM|nr:unnamed protein product [Echinostoma caproni]
MYVTAAVALKEQQSLTCSDLERTSDPIRVRWGQSKGLGGMQANGSDSIRKLEELYEETGSGSQLMKDSKIVNPIFSLSLSLADFRPLKAPFVPDLIRYLVNLIEFYCYKTDWRKMYDPLTEQQTEARNCLVQILEIGNNRAKELRRTLRTLNGPIRIAMLRIFLNAFSIKPLHFSTALVQELVQRPLYDHFLRPNPKLRNLVQRAAIPQSRTQLDTLAFLMSHMLHALDYNPDTVDGKMRLCNVYGPLLISFAERPQLCRLTQGNARSEEAALLDVILEVCDLHFWNHMSMLKISGAFAYKRVPRTVLTGVSDVEGTTPKWEESDARVQKSRIVDSSKEPYAEIVSASMTNEILRAVQLMGPMKGGNQTDETELLSALDPESRIPLPKRYCALSPLNIITGGRYRMLSTVRNLTTIPLYKDDSIPSTHYAHRESTLTGKYLSIFETKPPGQVHSYSTKRLLEESRLYRMGRISFPNRTVSLKPRNPNQLTTSTVQPLSEHTIAFCRADSDEPLASRMEWGD